MKGDGVSCVVCRQRGALAAAAGGHVGGRAVRVRAGRGRGRRLRAAAHARAAGAARRRAARRYRAPPAPALPARPARHTLTRPGGAPGRARPPGSAPAAHASSPSSTRRPAAPPRRPSYRLTADMYHIITYVSMYYSHSINATFDYVPRPSLDKFCRRRPRRPLRSSTERRRPLARE